MNPIYAIRESPHRWLILAGISFLLGTFGAVEMFALVWPHPLIETWLIALLVITAFFLVRALLDWRSRVLSEVTPPSRVPGTGSSREPSPAPSSREQ